MCVVLQEVAIHLLATPLSLVRDVVMSQFIPPPIPLRDVGMSQFIRHQLRFEGPHSGRLYIAGLVGSVV